MAQSSHAPLETTQITDLRLDGSAEAFISGVDNIFSFSLDNSQNTAKSFAKIFDGSPNLGTDAPDWVFRVHAGEVLEIIAVLGTGLDLALTSEPFLAGVTQGGTAGSTAPSNPFIGNFLTD